MSNVGAVWRQAACQLTRSDTPVLDARVLAMHVLGVDETGFVLMERAAFPAQHCAAYQALIARRQHGEPVARILGQREFCGLAFTLSPATLVPRPETELLVEIALDLVAGIKQPTIADLGTGTGCIAISLAVARPDLTVVAIDKSCAAIAVAQANALRHQVCRRINFVVGDWLVPIDQTFDLVVSNPPYISAGEASALPRDVRDHDPALALYAGENGLDAYRALIPQAKRCLVPSGALALEIGATQSAAVQRLLQDAGFNGTNTYRDLAGHDRVLVARVGG